MARFEILDANVGPLGEGTAVGDMLFELGMMYAAGRDVPVDLVSAHKWFNLAAAKGNSEAARRPQPAPSQTPRPREAKGDEAEPRRQGGADELGLLSRDMVKEPRPRQGDNPEDCPCP